MTILFLNDWNKYDAIVDDKTTNTSFLELSKLLKEMGVRNYYFFLVLFHKELQGVDPHSKDLTNDQKAKIALECKINPWYFLREVALVPASEPLRFKLIRPTLAMLWSFFCGIDFALTIPRQIGKSVACDALFIWLMYIYYKRADSFLFTKNNELRKGNIERIKKTLKLYPEWLIPLIITGNKKDADNTEIMTCKTLENTLYTAVPQKSKDEAKKVGRGLTIVFKQVDEVPYINNVQISLPALSSASDAAFDNCKREGIYHGSLYTTTAGELDTEEGAWTYGFFNSGMPWSEILYDAFDAEEAKQIVKNTSKEDRCLIYGVFSHRQCGKTDQWLRDILSKVPRTKEEIERDYLNKWTSGSLYSAIEKHLLEIINASEIEPSFTEITLDRFVVNWYIPRHEIANRMMSADYIMGLDTSNISGKDTNAIIIVDIRDMSVVASSKVSIGNLNTYAIWLANFLITYSRITLVIENKSSAQGIIDTITNIMLNKGINPFKRMYNVIVDDYIRLEDEYKFINQPVDQIGRNVAKVDSLKDKFGFKTNGNNRHHLFNTVLVDAAQSTGHLVRDKNLSSQLKGLIIKNGRVDHLANGHDDSVISWLLCHWFVKHSKNLKAYGIDIRLALSLVANEGATLTPEELAKRRRILQLNKEIDLLKERLISAPTLTEGLCFENQIKYKVNEAINLGDEKVSMNSILLEIEEGRKNRRKIRSEIARNNFNKMNLNGLYNYK